MSATNIMYKIFSKRKRHFLERLCTSKPSTIRAAETVFWFLSGTRRITINIKRSAGKTNV